MFDSFSARVRRTCLGVAIGQRNSACLQHVTSCVRIGVSRGRRGETWQRGPAAGVGFRMHVGAWDGVGGWMRVAGVRNGVTCCVAGHHFAWEGQRIVRGS